MNTPAELFCSCQCQLGEGPFRYADRLFWFDILQGELHSCDEQGDRHKIVQLNEMFSAGAVLENNALLLASESALWQFQTDTHELVKIHDLEADNKLTRSNDGRADRQGGFWISTMGKQAEKQAGSIYRFYRGELVALKTRVSIPNAICFAPAGDAAYFTDSRQGLIYRWTLDQQGWPVGDPEVWLDLSDQPVDPDGAVIDSEGYLWNAQWGGWQVVRYSPRGEVDRVVRLPVSRPTCPAFSSSGDRLLITSARTGLSAGELSREPLAGSVFMLNLDVPGIADTRVLLA